MLNRAVEKGFTGWWGHLSTVCIFCGLYLLGNSHGLCHDRVFSGVLRMCCGNTPTRSGKFFMMSDPVRISELIDVYIMIDCIGFVSYDCVGKSNG